MQKMIEKPLKPLEVIFDEPSLEYDLGFYKFLRYNIFFHLRPLIVPRGVARYTLCLGGITLALFSILSATGILLTFHYVPWPDRAYSGVVALSEAQPFGWLLRRVHRLAADGMVITVVLHMLRVYFTGSYKPPRQLNWVVGVFLLITTLALGFTGYLLPWDQLAYWAVTIGTNMADYVPFVGHQILVLLRGGESVGAVALLNFYALHVVLLPVAGALLIAIHLWRVRKQGISRPL